MLWRAGQERKARERRETLSALFVAARDAALDVGISTGELKARAGWKLPPYIEVAEPVRTPAARNAMLSRLAALFPGMVRRADS